MTIKLQLSEVLARLEEALETEQSLLFEARYTELDSICEVKLKLTEKLDRMLLDQDNAKHISTYRKKLAKIAHTAKNNEQMLQSAQIGVNQARNRINHILTRQRNVGVYAESGDKLLVPEAGITRTRLA